MHHVSATAPGYSLAPPTAWHSRSHVCFLTSVGRIRKPRTQSWPAPTQVTLKAQAVSTDAAPMPDASTSATGRSASIDQEEIQKLLTSKPAVARKALASQSAGELADLLLEVKPSLAVTVEDCQLLILSALDRAIVGGGAPNLALALSIYDCMLHARRRQSMGNSSSVSMDAAFEWPAATLQTTSGLVLGLCKQLAIDQALRAIADIKVQGLPRNDAVGFGKVVTSPLAPRQTLTVVQPQEGCKLVADAFSKYEYEVFTGRVVTSKSEALQPATGLLYAALRAVGALRRPSPAAVHEAVVQAPDGTARTFRMGTATADVPAQVGERVTYVCAPSTAMAGSSQRKRQRGLLDSSPPYTKPGEAMTATNHNTGAVIELLPPPLSNTQTTMPNWVLPVVVLLVGGDAASSLLDPSLPALVAASALAIAGTGVVGDRLLIPKLKQLPDRAVGIEYIRQGLLGQYAQLAARSDTVMAEAADDVRVLSRLWQLQHKMQSVGAGASTSYAARMERVGAARGSLEQRLTKKLELLDGYARVMNMIEIEVEMDIEVPQAELEGIATQMVRLSELEDLQDEWRGQAAARDEVERLLRAV